MSNKVENGGGVREGHLPWLRQGAGDWQSKPVAAVFRPNADRLRSLGYHGIASVPVLFGKSGSYLREQNRYLREVACAEWPDRLKDGPHRRSPRHPRYLTLKARADDLLNFQKFADHDFIQLDWRTVKYVPDIVRYSEAMLTGAWSAAGDPLDTGTAERRVNATCDFLVWASTRDLRGNFKVPEGNIVREFTTYDSSRPSYEYKRVRIRQVRKDPVTMRVPSGEELEIWLSAVQKRCGSTKQLMCRTTVQAALRRNEAAQLPEDVLPVEESDWHVIGDNVLVTLSKGTKGGVERPIIIPLSLARDIDSYRRGKRLTALAKWIKRNPGQPKPSRLFLSQYDGSPISVDRLYDAWRSHLVYKGWSPHLARHTWACHTLLEAIRHTAIQHKLTMEDLPISWILTTVDSVMEVTIKPQLGHLSKRTTQSYVRWISAHFIMPRAYSSWHDHLEHEPSN